LGLNQHLGIGLDADHLGEQLSEQQCDCARAAAHVDQTRRPGQISRGFERLEETGRVGGAPLDTPRFL
jgi:hypothetical protein